MKKILLLFGGLLLVGVLIGYGIGWLSQQAQQPAERIPILVEEDVPEREVQLYFGDPKGTFLQAESRLIKGCDDDRDCIRGLLEAIRAGSQQGLLPVLPKETGILDIELENDLVRVDFSRHLSDFHPGGSLSELLTVYSLVNSLSENFPYLRQLQILLDGEVRQTLKGHVRIDQPIYADFSYADPPLAGPQPDSPETAAAEVDSVLDTDLKIEEVKEDESFPAGN